MTGAFRWSAALLGSGAMCVCLAVPSLAGEQRPWAAQGCMVGASAASSRGERAGSGQAQDRPGVVARMSSDVSSNGSIMFHAAAGDLDITKRVSRDGAYTLRLIRGDDAVEI